MTNEYSDEGLKRVIGAPGLAMSIINCTIGAGIFALPALVAAQLGTFSIFAYLFCGVMLAIIMLCYAEIGTRITTSGGSYAYVEAAFGHFPGFIINWLFFFGWGILGSAALINIIADSLMVLFPIFAQPFARALLFIVLIGWMVLVNVRGSKESVRFVSIITMIKLLPLIGIIIFGISHIQSGNLQLGSLPTTKSFGDATLILFFAFAGFETALNVSGEIKNPNRNVPLGILIGGGTVLILYILLQTVTQGVLGANIVEFKNAPLSAVADKIIGPIGGTILLIAAAISCFGSVSSDVLATPRLLFAGAKVGLFPKYLGKVHPKFATPHWAVITYSFLIFVFSVSGGFKELAIMASCAVLLIYLGVILAMIKLRKQTSLRESKTFKVPGGFVVPLIGIACILWLLSHLSAREIISTVVFIAIVSIIYLGMLKWKNRQELPK